MLINIQIVTKAGVPTYKIYVGESSYGRSFKMSEAGCTDPECTFLGDRSTSPAAPGRCTATGGYISNAEIYDIINFGNVNQQWHDNSDSDVIVYDGKHSLKNLLLSLSAREPDRYLWDKLSQK